MSKDTPQKPEFSRKTPKRPAAKKPAAKAPKDHEGDRIAKVMARVGLCSRRDAELWIEQGRVAVNGEVLTSAARNVTGEDRISVDGKPLAARERTRLFLFHKPRGLVATDRDPEGRPTVFDYVAEKYPDLPRLMSVGRLDINTEGLLLLTNDGGLARVLELPATGWLRRYRARAHGETDQARLDVLAKGVTIDGMDYAGVEARLDRVQGANAWITLGLREGKNREVKKLLEYLGLAVNRLIRLSYGPFQLGEMDEGAVEEVKTKILADQLGAKLAAEANVDFEAPIFEPEPEEPVFSRAPRSGPPRAKKPLGAEPEKKRGEREPRRPGGAQKPEPRKHVSALRDDRSKAEKGPRRRTENLSTEDRNGRKVAVERVTLANPRPEAAAPQNRNARRFAAERGEAAKTPRPERSFSGEAGAKKYFRRDAEGGDFGQSGRDFGKGAREPGKGGQRTGKGGQGAGKAFAKGFGKGAKPGGAKFSGPKFSGPKPAGGKFSGPKPVGGKPARPRKPRES